MRVMFALICLISTFSAIGQSVFEVASEYELTERKAKTYSDKLLNVQDKFQGSKKWSKRVKEECQKRSDYFLELNDQHQLMAQGQLTEFIQSIADRIVNQNPDLSKRKIKIFVLRNSAVNAHSLGEGIIFFNIGLLARLKDVNELAFILAHEMAHDVSEHNYISIVKKAKFKDTEEYKELKKASRKKFGSATALEKMYSKIFASMGLHSRSNEVVADELGAQYALKAGFSRKGIIRALELLKDSDKPMWTDSLDIQQLLSTPDYAIQTKFLTEVDAYSAWTAMESLHETPDSLRTHPHCEERIENVQSKMANSHDNASELDMIFQSMQTQILYEYLHTLFEENNLGRALYFAMVQKNRGDTSVYLDGLIDICLFDLAYGIREQSFSDKCQFPDASYSNGYNAVLEFAHAQNSKRFLKMANGYFQAHLADAEKFELNNVISLYEKYFNDGFIRQSDIKKATIKNGFYKELILQLKQ